MKIGNELLEVTILQKVKIVATFVVSYILVLVLLDALFEETLQSPIYYLIKGGVSGILFSLVLYGVARFFTKKIAPKVEFPLDDDEVVEASGVANLFMGKEAVGGKLGITQKALIFHSHKFNIQTGTVRIPLNRIKKIRPCKTLWLVDNGLEVQTDLQTCRFVVNDRATWIKTIQAKLN